MYVTEKNYSKQETESYLTEVVSAKGTHSQSLYSGTE